jgi:ADP-ribosylglycohydrolase
MSRLKDAIYGLAVGDALGVPYEFEIRNTFQCVDMIGYGTHNQPEGTWSDDTSMTLALCSSLKKQNEKINCEDIRKEFEQWFFNGKYTPFGTVFDCGNTCEIAIRNGIGQTHEQSNGNGSLMRILPLAFIEDISDHEIEEVSAITHANIISKQACVIYIRIVKDLLNGFSLNESIIRNVTEDSMFNPLLRINEYSVSDIRSGGYVVDTLIAAVWCLNKTNNYKDCVLMAVNLGNDTDTTAAVAGGLAGILYGYDQIPAEWIKKLKRKRLIEDCLF